MSDTKALATYDSGKFAILNQNISALPEILEANIGAGEEINEFDMDRVGVPSGGGLSWSVPDISGEPQPVTELEGVVLLHGDRRSFWLVDFDNSGGGTPPDCSSKDAKRGYGKIRGDEVLRERTCRTCPMSQWGSADPGDKDNNAQACTQRKILYFMREDDVLPLIVDLAPTSVGEFNRFMLRLTRAGVPSYGAVVGLKLKVEQSGGGIKYSSVKPRLIAKLDDDEMKRMKAVADAMRPYFVRTGVEGGAPAQEPTIEGNATGGEKGGGDDVQF